MKRRSWHIIGVVVLLGCGVFVGRYAHRESDAVIPVYPAGMMRAGWYDQAYASAPGSPAHADVRAILVNHHLLAPHLIAQAMELVASDESTTVVLVSPDHFGRGRAPLTSVVARWDTPYGIIESDTDAITMISPGVDVYAWPFALEHGIFNITGFIKRSLPSARLVPIIVKDNAPDAVVDEVARVIARLPGRVLVVGSFDFTHESTMAQAERNDAVSVSLLKAGDESHMKDIAVDSHAGLRLLMQYAQLKQLDFTLVASTNSARITGRHEQTDVTSYITGYWTSKAQVLH